MNTDLQKGADNLLLTCAGLVPGDRLLVLHEGAEETYYHNDILDAVLDRARTLGIEVATQEVPVSPDGAVPDETLVTQMKAATRSLFLARFGDQIRFNADMAGICPIMSYALDAGMLASGFGQGHYHGFVAIKNAVNRMVARAEDIHVTCPLGTDFRGDGAKFPTQISDVAVTRFPMSVFAPVPAGNFSGQVVQHGFLVGTGSRFYEPYACALETPVTFTVHQGRITALDGDDSDVSTARQHYDRVSARYGIDPWVIHSWHAGIHPGCNYRRPVAENFARWSGAAFGNPRLLHFHTCGSYAPGEISLNVLDPTICLDGVAVWNGGRFDANLVTGVPDILNKHPDIARIFDEPSRNVGQCPEETLSGTWA
ncbi:hypothetical protein [Tropicibacter sp. Alg240-R139]|uniref:hypothetical protein n=1 Tax=Tropicibacter sp. Alg240-R139 TaxID=2305991 RepID=UPI0013E0CA49|nr:hypothetical protein [Tropicibacter sp. Alg240-R139]